MINAYDEREKYKQINVGDELILYQGNVKCLGIVINKNDRFELELEPLTIYRNLTVQINQYMDSGKKVDIPYAHGVERHTFTGMSLEDAKYDGTITFGSVEYSNHLQFIKLSHPILEVVGLGVMK
tara:strand:- start:48 stop:422 length:375 start_codon:yes stop_codon:yes gene_type:complete